MQKSEALSVLSSAVECARFCETRAQALDGALERLSRGEGLPPHELHAILLSQQQAYRRTGAHALLVATLLLRSCREPWWLRAWRRLRYRARKSSR